MTRERVGIASTVGWLDHNHTNVLCHLRANGKTSSLVVGDVPKVETTLLWYPKEEDKDSSHRADDANCLQLSLTSKGEVTRSSLASGSTLIWLNGYPLWGLFSSPHVDLTSPDKSSNISTVFSQEESLLLQVLVGLLQRRTRLQRSFRPPFFTNREEPPTSNTESWCCHCSLLDC